MNLEGKQQIWKDYQKEIADDHYFYARSCIRQTFFPGSEWAYLDIMKNKLAKDVIDDPRHTTCTGTSARHLLNIQIAAVGNI